MRKRLQESQKSQNPCFHGSGSLKHKCKNSDLNVSNCQKTVKCKIIIIRPNSDVLETKKKEYIDEPCSQVPSLNSWLSSVSVTLMCDPSLSFKSKSASLPE